MIKLKEYQEPVSKRYFCQVEGRYDLSGFGDSPEEAKKDLRKELLRLETLYKDRYLEIREFLVSL